MNIKYFIILLIFCVDTFACLSSSAPEGINLSLSLTNKKVMIFTDEGETLDTMPSIVAGACSESAKKDQYLMFAIGIENFILSDELLSFSINDTLSYDSKDKCRIENLKEIKGTTKDDRNKRLQHRRHLVNHCISFDVRDDSETGLELPKEGQPGCSLTRVDENTANFYGFFCFFKPKIDSKFTITPKVAPKCLEENFYKENKFELQDILGTLEMYAAGDATGRSSKLEFLKDVKFRLSMNPDGVIATNKSRFSDVPKWPVNWKVRDIKAGKINIVPNSAEILKLNVPIFVNNQCEEKTCTDGLCTSSCEYTQPVASELTLFDITNPKKEEYIKSWFDGGIAPAKWAGMINGTGIDLSTSSLEDGHKYKIEIAMDDQEFNYMMYKGQIESRLTLNPSTIPNLTREGTKFAALNPFNEIQVFKELPKFPVFDMIKFSGSNHVGVKNTVNSISRVFKNTVWPPYFDNYCSEGRCVLKKNHKLRLSLTFKLKIDEKKKYIIEDITYEKSSSNTDTTIAINDYKAPYFTCDNPNSDPDDDDWDDDDFGDIDF